MMRRQVSSFSVIVHQKVQTGRRSLCYDRAALDSRKENKPGGNAIEMASSIGIEVLTEQQYRELQELGEFDREDFELGENASQDTESPGWCALL
jgi:hypothetical protein